MMTDNGDKLKGEAKADRDIQIVNELYKLADQLYGDSSLVDDLEFDRLVSTRKPVQHLSDDSSEQQASTRAETNHVWIVHLLTDLAEYAKTEDLILVEECIRDTQHRVSDLLSSRALRDNTLEPESYEDDAS